MGHFLGQCIAPTTRICRCVIAPGNDKHVQEDSNGDAATSGNSGAGKAGFGSDDKFRIGGKDGQHDDNIPRGGSLLPAGITALAVIILVGAVSLGFINSHPQVEQ